MRLLFVLSLSLLTFGCSSKEGKPCPADGSCGGELRCEPVTKICQSVCGKPADCKKGLTCDEKEGICFSERVRRKEIECQESEWCKEFGMCSAVDGECKVTKDEHCANSSLCKEGGWCSAVDGACKATKDEHCAESRMCIGDDLCFTNDGVCKSKATKDEDCAKLCKEFGMCSAVDGFCKATMDEHCAGSEVCKTLVMCSAVDGACKATKDDCAELSSSLGTAVSMINGFCIKR